MRKEDREDEEVRNAAVDKLKALIGRSSQKS